MKYYLFAGMHYYADGGAEDLAAVCESVESAKNKLARLKDGDDFDWAHIMDGSGRIIENWSNNLYGFKGHCAECYAELIDPLGPCNCCPKPPTLTKDLVTVTETIDVRKVK